MLASAVANAVAQRRAGRRRAVRLACFADEGPTLRRFRPRARGRATRIRKRTCHITVVVARLERRAPRGAAEPSAGAGRRAARRAGTPAQSRRDRVAAQPGPRREPSRQRAADDRPSTVRHELPKGAEPSCRRRRHGADGDELDEDEVVADEVADELEEEAAETGCRRHRRERAGRRAEAEARRPAGGCRRLHRGRLDPRRYRSRATPNSMKYHVPGRPLLRRHDRRGLLRHARARRGRRLRSPGSGRPRRDN